ncbi:uncharacterized protein [Antedon mediterranea]|uniref:uncharacterized protein isoform X2 n=1 Tax=Antedon mediterranea TaxID=105859 RepID=UPI003AF557CE
MENMILTGFSILVYIILISCTKAVIVDLILQPSNTVIENHTVELNCSFQRSNTSVIGPLIIWYKIDDRGRHDVGRHQGIFNQVTDKTRMNIHDYVLTIQPVKRSDSGVYECQVTIIDDEPYMNSDTGNVSILYLDSPSIVLTTEGVTCTSGNAYPEPSLIIYNNSKEVASTNETGVVLKYRTKDDGTNNYYCRAKNKAGERDSKLLNTGGKDHTSPTFYGKVTNTSAYEGDPVDDQGGEVPIFMVIMLILVLVMIIVVVVIILKKCGYIRIKAFRSNQEITTPCSSDDSIGENVLNSNGSVESKTSRDALI